MSALTHVARRFMSAATRSSTTFVRPFSSATAQTIDDVNDLFAEARLCLQDAIESKGTVYFADDFADAKEATEATLAAFDALLESSDANTRRSLLDANRPKMAQLAEEFRQLEQELIHDD